MTIKLNPMQININQWLQILREGEGEGGGGGDGTGDGEKGEEKNAGSGAEQSGGEGDKNKSNQDDTETWYDKMEWSDTGLKEQLIQSGYHKGTIEEALQRSMQHEQAAQRKLGKPADALLDAPAEGQDVSEWLKSNGSTLGIPDAPDGYETKLPEDLPDGLPVDEDLLTGFKAKMHETGATGAMVQAGLDFYVDHIKGVLGEANQTSAQSEVALDAELKTAWGADFKTNQQEAARAFQVLGADQGLTPEEQSLVASKLNGVLGDAVLVKFMHGIAKRLGSDTLELPGGMNKAAVSIQDAKARKDEIMGPSGEMVKARGNAGAEKKLKEELGRLNELIASQM